VLVFAILYLAPIVFAFLTGATCPAGACSAG